ncbi:hypothetical protein J7L13_02240 [bacterium]|nr:hypothetical protein [bacterium]
MEWDYALLETRARDALAVLHTSGSLERFIRFNNATGLEQTLSKLLPESVMFSAEIEGLPKPLIRIGCNCSDEEIKKLKTMLHINLSNDKVITFNSRNITFGYVKINLNDLRKKAGEIDVLLFFGYRNFSPYKSSVENFLKQDKGIFAIADLNATHLDDPYFAYLFNLSSSPGNPAAENSFAYQDDVEKISYHASRLFTSMPVRIDTHVNTEGYFYIRNEAHNITTAYDGACFVMHDDDATKYRMGEVFTVTDSENSQWHVKIRYIDCDTLDGRTFVDISIIDRNYTFKIINNPNHNRVSANEKTVLSTSNHFASVQVNYDMFYGKGRAVWMKHYPANRSDVNQLFKSLLLYAAGEKYRMETYTKPMPKKYRSVTYFMPSGAFDAPFIVRLFLWFIY